MCNDDRKKVGIKMWMPMTRNVCIESNKYMYYILSNNTSIFNNTNKNQSMSKKFIFHTKNIMKIYNLYKNNILLLQ